MVKRALLATMVMVAMTGVTAFGDAKDDLSAAINKTADAANYSWTTTVEGGFGGGKTTGKTEKDGYTQLNIPMRDQSFDVVIKGKKAVIKTDDGWKSASDLANDQGGGFNPTRFVAMMTEDYKTPLAQAQADMSKVQDVKAEGDTYTGTLTEAAVKEMMTFRRRGNRPAPEIKNAKGDVKVWTKDGMVTKAAIHVTGTINFRGEDRDIDRTTTTEISDVGSTKVDVPEDAKKKLEEAGSATTAPQ